MERKIIKYSQIGAIISDIVRHGEWRIQFECSRGTVFPNRVYPVHYKFIIYDDENWESRHLLIDDIISFKSEKTEYFIIHA